MSPEQDCLFCKIVRKQVPCQIVHEDERVIAFRDIHPQAPTHVLVVPKRHVAGIHEVAAADGPRLGEWMLAAADVARRLGIHEAGYRLVINAKADGGQTVDHLHVHVLGGRRMQWPPG